MIDIDEIIKRNNLLEDSIETLRQAKAFVLYGFGEAFPSSYDACKSVGLIPKYIIDSDRSKHGTLFDGNIPVGSIQSAIEKLGLDIVVLITSPRYCFEIREELNRYIDNKTIYDFSIGIHQISDAAFGAYLQENKNEFCKLYKLLADDQSRKILEKALEGRLTYDTKCFQEIYTGNMYFPKDVFILSATELFLDIGAYDGDSLSDFIDASKGKYRRVICMEPDKEAFGKLTSKARLYHDVDTINAGAYDKTGHMPILAANGGSKILNTSFSVAEPQTDVPDEVFCNVIKIDEELLRYPVTLIKMDIEGSELAALRGAERLICKYKPKLAISVYHRDSDLLDISAYILELNENYKLYLRHHTPTYADTVLYAI